MHEIQPGGGVTVSGYHESVLRLAAPFHRDRTLLVRMIASLRYGEQRSCGSINCQLRSRCSDCCKYWKNSGVACPRVTEIGLRYAMDKTASQTYYFLQPDSSKCIDERRWKYRKEKQRRMAGKHYFLLRRKVTGSVSFTAISAQDSLAKTALTATRNSTEKGEQP